MIHAGQERGHFEEFARVYDERFQPKYGYWRPTSTPTQSVEVSIYSAIDKFPTCGELREGFARVRCPKPAEVAASDSLLWPVFE